MHKGGKMSNNNLHHILDETDIEEWADRLGRNGRVKVVRSRPMDEESRETGEKNPRRRKKMNNIPSVAQNPPQPRPIERTQPNPLPLLERVAQLSDLQKKRDEYETRRKTAEAEHTQMLSLRREAEGKIYSQLESITPRELGILQSRLITVGEEKMEELRQAVKTLSEIANKANQVKLAVTAENYIKTAEAFRLIWQGLTLEQKEERALAARVSPDNAKAFYRAALAYQKELVKAFLEMIPPQWREAIEGKAPTPEPEVEAEAES